MGNKINLIYKDSKSNKFYNVSWDNNSYTVQYGRVGSIGTSTTTNSSNPEVDARKKVKSKINKGYVEISENGEIEELLGPTSLKTTILEEDFVFLLKKYLTIWDSSDEIVNHFLEIYIKEKDILSIFSELVFFSKENFKCIDSKYDKQFEKKSCYLSVVDWKVELNEFLYKIDNLLSTRDVKFDVDKFELEFYENGCYNISSKYSDLEVWMMDLNEYLKQYNLVLIYLNDGSDQITFTIVPLDESKEILSLFKSLDIEKVFRYSLLSTYRKYPKKTTARKVKVNENAIKVKMYNDGKYKYIYFGNYPNTILEDRYIIKELDKLQPNEDGHYIFDENKYVKNKANLCESKYARSIRHTYKNYKEKINGEELYFLVEPIRWNVISTNKEIKLVSTNVLDRAIFTESTTDIAFETSELRKQLNNDFYNKAFTHEEKNLIVETNVDNSISMHEPYRPKSTSYHNTNDKIYSLSYKENYMKKYGFETGIYDYCNQRKAVSTDYASSLGVHQGEHNGGVWLCRTPFSYGGSGQTVSHGPEVQKYSGLRPAMNLDVKNIVLEQTEVDTTINIKYDLIKKVDNKEIFCKITSNEFGYNVHTGELIDDELLDSKFEKIESTNTEEDINTLVGIKIEDGYVDVQKMYEIDKMFNHAKKFLSDHNGTITKAYIPKLQRDSIELLKQASTFGNIDAQIYLGWLYIDGRTVIKDLEKSFYYFKLAADNGNAPAQNTIGVYYKGGTGVEVDIEKAIHYYTLSANNGYNPAQRNLASCYKNGIGVEVDLEKAFYYYKLSSDQGNVDDQRNLGICYKNGLGVEVDLKKSFYYFKLAADNGNAPAQNTVGVYYKGGTGVGVDIEKAIHYYTLSANNGYNPARRNLASCYINGLGVEVDLEKAFYYYKLSADQGNVDDQNTIAFSYENGIGVEVDLEKAFYYYELSANNGNHSAQRNLGICYKNGIGVEVDLEKAFYYFKLAADNGNAPAQNTIGVYYKGGIGVEVDLEKSFYYFKLAADKGHVSSQNSVAVCYEEGVGVEVDLEKAIYYYTLAADNGDSDAQRNLAYCYKIGLGVDINVEKQFHYLRLAIANGNAYATNSLGYYYHMGEGIEVDFEKAFYYYKLSAEKNNSLACSNLGECYEDGIGTKIDYEKAMYYYKKSLELGSSDAKEYIEKLELKMKK